MLRRHRPERAKDEVSRLHDAAVAAVARTEALLDATTHLRDLALAAAERLERVADQRLQEADPGA